MANDRIANVVVVDDEKYICNIVTEALASEDYNVVAFSQPEAALEFIEDNPIDLVLTDLVMGDYTGVQLLEATLNIHKDAIVILMTAHPTVQTAISVLKKGAYDFLVKPFKLNILKAAIKRGLEHQKVVSDNLRLKGQLEFLKVANASVAEVDMNSFFELVVSSCKKELSAEAVCVMELDPDSREIIRMVHDASSEDRLKELSKESYLTGFGTRRSNQPVIRKEQIEVEGKSSTKILILQPIYIRRKLHGMITLVAISRFDELTRGQLDALAILSNSTAAVIANHRLYDDLQRSYLEAISGLANAIEARDEYTAGHTDRVSRLAAIIAEGLGWSQSQIDELIVGCTLHDIGKIGVPDSILNKPSQLDPEERLRMISHCEVGLRIIRGIDLFKPAIPYIMAHHEWYNGKGYPNGYKGEEIPIEGRLLAVADTFDAILSDRPYRKGGTFQTALSELLKYRGIQFDPQVVDAFIKIIRAGKVDFKEMYGRDEDLSVIDELMTIETVSV